jgi:hypothetical protein
MKQFIYFLLLVISSNSYAGEFLQADRYSDNSSTIVGSLEYDSISISAIYAEWDESSLTGASVGYVINEDLKAIIGPSVMRTDGDTKYGIKASLEDFNMYEEQSVFWQVSINTIEKSWNAVLQYSPVYKHSIEACIGDTDDYNYQTVAYSYKLTKIISLRLGYRINDSTVFFGLSLNTF